jgi:hypothetical protein
MSSAWGIGQSPPLDAKSVSITPLFLKRGGEWERGRGGEIVYRLKKGVYKAELV